MFDHGQLVYLQIPATDITASARFYERVLGWDVDPPESGFEAPGLIGQWITDRPPAPDAGPVMWIHVDDVAHTLTEAEGAGATLRQEPTPDGPRLLASFSDPAGNLVGIAAHGPARAEGSAGPVAGARVENRTMPACTIIPELVYDDVTEAMLSPPSASSTPKPSTSPSKAPVVAPSKSTKPSASSSPSTPASPTPSTPPSQSAAPNVAATGSGITPLADVKKKLGTTVYDLGTSIASAAGDPTQIPAAQLAQLAPFAKLSAADVAALPPTMQFYVPTISCKQLNDRVAGVLTTDAALKSQVVSCDTTSGSMSKYLLDSAKVHGEDIASASFAYDLQNYQGWYVTLNFKGAGQANWANLTKDVYNQSVTAGSAGSLAVAIVLDNEVVTAPAIQSGDRRPGHHQRWLHAGLGEAALDAAQVRCAAGLVHPAGHPERLGDARPRAAQGRSARRRHRPRARRDLLLVLLPSARPRRHRQPRGLGVADLRRDRACSAAASWASR